MALFAVNARVTRTTRDGWTQTRELPTFYLGQGIVSEEGARRVARHLLQDASFGALDCQSIDVHATRVDSPPKTIQSKVVPTEYDVEVRDGRIVINDDRGRIFVAYSFDDAFEKAEAVQDPSDPIHHHPFPSPAEVGPWPKS